MLRARLVLVLVLALAVPLFASCASLTVENMVPERTDFGGPHSGTVAVGVTGGSSGVKWFSATIEPAELESAIRATLEQASLFRDVVEPEVADYLVEVRLIYAGSHPGFTMTGWVNAAWKLSERGSDVPLFNAEFQTEGKATTGEAWIGAKRQYLALERSGKLNIEQALTALGSLDLVAP